MKKFKFSIDGNNFEVSVNELDNNTMDVVVNGSNYTVVVDKEVNKVSNATVAAPVAKKTPGKVDPIPAPTPSSSAKVVTVKSQLPGSIIKVMVTEGQSVKKGEVIMTIESMKMENSIMAEADGVISKIYVEAGKSVMQDDKLVDIAVSGAPVAAPAPAPAAPVAKPAPASAPAPAPAPAPAASAANAKPVKSPLPGSIIKILVSEGESVKRGQTLLTMESMKMENEIKAEKDGVVTSIKVTPGQNVMQEDDLLMMA